jgi:transposase-like protein
MGTARKNRRGAMLVEKQEQFVRLIARGVSNSEACRIVGINRRTGTRWRYGRTILNTAGEPVHYPPVRFTTAKPRHPRYLSLIERTTIADLHRAGVSVRSIAQELGRAASTVSRELRRNVDDRGRYSPAAAERLTIERRTKVLRPRRLTRDVQLYGVVAKLLGKRWSQVAHHQPAKGRRGARRILQRHLVDLIYRAMHADQATWTHPIARCQQAA